MANIPKGPFFLVIVYENAETDVKSFAAVEGLTTCLRGLPPTAQGYCFHGDRLHVTRAPWRFLLHGDKQLPLFDEPKPDKIDPSGWLGFGDANDKEKVADDKYKELLAQEELQPEEDDFDD